MAIRDGYPEGVPSWSDLTSTDTESSKRFYTSLFGWEFTAPNSPAAGDYSYATLAGHRVAGVGAPPPGQQAPTVWTTYFAVEDADKSAARIAENGGTVLAGPIEVGRSGRFVTALDPTGAGFGLWEAGTHNGAQWVNAPGGVGWNELNTPDLATATAFYSAVLGVTWAAHGDGGGPVYQVFSAGDALAGGATESTTPFWRVYFVVADTDATVSTATGLGATVTTPPFDTPNGRTAHLADPNGTPFTVIQSQDPAADPAA
jgi:predicted enzyme related to lactoylglutathione lyase